MKGRIWNKSLSVAAAQYAFAAYHITDEIQDSCSIRIRNTVVENPVSLNQSDDFDLVDVNVFRGSGNGLAFVGETRGSIQLDSDDLHRYRLLVISFRGTERASLHNWLTNLSIVRNSICSGSTEMVHSGFLNHWKSLVNAGLLRHVVDRIDKDTKILLTGHSLGGAIAFLSAYHISELINQSPEIFVYTFGAPRIGNDEFERNYSVRVPLTFSIGHPLDPICAVGAAAASYAGSWMEHAVSELMRPSTVLSGLSHGLMFLTAGPFNVVRSSAIAVRSVPPIIRYARLFMAGVCVGVAVRAFYLGIKFHGGYCPDFVTEIVPSCIDKEICSGALVEEADNEQTDSPIILLE